MDFVAKPKGESHVSDFMYYCRYYTRGYRRYRPLRDATINRYYRGLCLAEKIVGHSIEMIDEKDQLVFMEKIKDYKQGTRKVTTEIFQRYIAWLIRKEHYKGPNLINGHVAEIIGEWEPVQVQVKNAKQIGRWFNRLQTPIFRIVFGLMYYGGLTAEEIASIKTEAVTEKGVFVRRRVRNEMQLLPLPPRFLAEVQEYAQTREDTQLFDFPPTDRGRGTVAQMFNAAKVEAGYLRDMTMKDFRRSGIKHFYDHCYDVELTKRFAGVKSMQRGWLDSLQDEASFYMETVAKDRKYYGKKKLQADKSRAIKADAELRASQS